MFVSTSRPFSTEGVENDTWVEYYVVAVAGNHPPLVMQWRGELTHTLCALYTRVHKVEAEVARLILHGLSPADAINTSVILAKQAGITLTFLSL